MAAGGSEAATTKMGFAGDKEKFCQFANPLKQENDGLFGG